MYRYLLHIDNLINRCFILSVNTNSRKKRSCGIHFEVHVKVGIIVERRKKFHRTVLVNRVIIMKVRRPRCCFIAMHPQGKALAFDKHELGICLRHILFSPCIRGYISLFDLIPVDSVSYFNFIFHNNYLHSSMIA